MLVLSDAFFLLPPSDTLRSEKNQKVSFESPLPFLFSRRVPLLDAGGMDLTTLYVQSSVELTRAHSKKTHTAARVYDVISV